MYQEGVVWEELGSTAILEANPFTHIKAKSACWTTQHAHQEEHCLIMYTSVKILENKQYWNEQVSGLLFAELVHLHHVLLSECGRGRRGQKDAGEFWNLAQWQWLLSMSNTVGDNGNNFCNPTASYEAQFIRTNTSSGTGCPLTLPLPPPSPRFIWDGIRGQIASTFMLSNLRCSVCLPWLRLLLEWARTNYILTCIVLSHAPDKNSIIPWLVGLQ